MMEQPMGQSLYHQKGLLFFLRYFWHGKNLLKKFDRSDITKEKIFYFCENSLKGSYHKKSAQRYCFYCFNANKKLNFMENQSKPILVPTDFTVVSQYAIESAVPFAKASNAEVVLLHIVKKSSEIPEAITKVELEAEKLTKEHGVTMKGIVREGTIFTAVGEAVTELDASLVFMGTHGITGLQKLTGSWALKVILSSKAPIIVAQTHPKKMSVNRIAFPIDYKRENREKIGWAYYVAKMFNAKVYVFRAEPAKDRKIEQNIRTNLVFTERFLRSKNVDFEVAVAKGNESFAKESVQYAEEINADLVLITTTKLVTKIDFVLGPPVEQTIINNEFNIPVMCINPRKGKIDGFSATGG